MFVAIFSQQYIVHNLSRLVQVLGHESAELGSHRLSPARASAGEDDHEVVEAAKAGSYAIFHDRRQ